MLISPPLSFVRVLLTILMLNAICFLHVALNGMVDNVDVRLTLASLLVESNRTEEAIQLLLPPQQLGNFECLLILNAY